MCIICILSCNSSDQQSGLNTQLSLSKKVKTHRIIAATRPTSALLKGLLQQVRQGERFDFRVSYHIDQALEAFQDQVILAALSTDYSMPDQGQEIAQSELIWASSKKVVKLSEQEWSKFLGGQDIQWPDGTPFSLCFRQTPDPLEEIWLQHRPHDRDLIEKARKSGRWPIFETEQSLIDYLTSHKGALGLFVEANLKVKAVPLSKVYINEQAPVLVKAYLYLRQQRDLPSKLRDLRDLVISPDRLNVVQEWGWN